MKKLLILSVMSLVLTFNIVFTQGEELEVYKPKVIIDAVLTHDSQLGALPGNFVIHYGVDWIGGVQPSDIDVDKEGNIYILDMGNDRIQKFNADGQFIGIIPVKECYVVDYRDTLHPLHHYKKEFKIDKDGNFIVLDSGHTKDRAEEIIKNDKNGNELERYDLSSFKKTNPNIFNDGIKGMKLDENDVPFFEDIYFDNDIREIKVKDIVRVRSKGKNVESINMKLTGKRYMGIDKKSKKYEIEKLSKNDWTIGRKVKDKGINKIDIKASWLHMLGEDLNGNLFVLVDNAICKYNKDNKLVATMNTSDYWWGEEGVLSLKYNMEESMFIDDKGNFYLARLLEKENKLQVIRWSKQE